MRTMACGIGLWICPFLLTVAGAESVLPGRAVAVKQITPLVDRPATNYHVRQTLTPPVIDGKAGEWDEVPAMVLDSGGVWRNARWEGPADLSGTLQLLWDHTALYFCLRVKDDVHSALNADKDFWKNDSIQFVFDACMNGPAGYDSDEHSYTVCDSPRGPLMASYYSPFTRFGKETLMPQQTVKMSVQSGGERVYEWAMPWTALNPVSPWLLGRCGFGWSLSDNDGKGFKGALFWSKGVVFRRDASQLGQLIFDGAAGTQPALLGLRPEWKPLKAEAQSRWLTVEGAEPWNAARLLVATPTAGPVEATVAVFHPGEKKPVARGELKADIAAGEITAFTWDMSGLPSGQYELAYAAQIPPSVKLDAGRRIACCHVNVERLRSQVGRIRQQFGLDRPWDTMADASAVVRRHRGLVAEMMEWIELGQPMSGVPDYIPFDEQPLQILEAMRVVEAVDAGRDYLGAKRGQFWSAYYSTADGSGQHFVMSVPKSYTPRKTYPLIVALHGSGGRPTPDPLVTDEHDYLQVDPWGRGDNGFRALGENDVLSTIQYVKDWYSVDPDRVYISGGSMGGGGTWRIASRRPDLFAAAGPSCGWADDAPLENLRNVPVFNQHGTRDWIVSIDFSRYLASRLEQWGYPIVYNEVLNAGHGSSPSNYPARDWLRTLSRASQPRAVTFTCHRLAPPMNTAYWLTVAQMDDSHVPAQVNAVVIEQGRPQAVSLGLENVAVLALDTSKMPVDRRQSALLQVGCDVLQVAAPLPERLFVLRDGEHWSVTNHWAPPVAGIRPYCTGAAANLYTGEPMMIVYGGGGDAARLKVLREAAESLARWPGAGGDMPTGRFPVKSDREVSADDLQHFNLILLGGPHDNRLTEMILEKAAVRITDKNDLIAGAREPVSLSGAGLRFFYYNPLAPQRLVFLIATDEDSEQARKWYGVARRLLSGSGDGNEGDAPDLVVQTFGFADQAGSPQAGAGRPGVDRRRMQFTDGWQWRALAGADCPAPAGMAGVSEMERARLRVMRRATGADVALGWGAKAEDKEFDPPWFTLADMATARSPGQTLLCEMTGAELMEIQQEWVVSNKVTSVPACASVDVDSNRIYRVAMPPELCGMLGGDRKKNLRAVVAGPDWRAEQLWAEVFGEDAARKVR